LDGRLDSEGRIRGAALEVMHREALQQYRRSLMRSNAQALQHFRRLIEQVAATAAAAHIPPTASGPDAYTTAAATVPDLIDLVDREGSTAESGGPVCGEEEAKGKDERLRALNADGLARQLETFLSLPSIPDR
jgi:hypothetical protein